MKEEKGNSNQVNSYSRVEIADAVDCIRDKLKKYKIPKREVTRIMLVAEESMVTLFEHAKENEQIKLNIYKLFGKVSIELSAQGEKYEFEEEISVSPEFEEDDPQVEGAIRSSIFQAFGDELKYKHKNGINKIAIGAVKNRNSTMLAMVAAMILGVVFGIAMKNSSISDGAIEWVRGNVLATISTLFLNALKMVIAPLIFFSIATSISGFNNMKEVGRIATKTMLVYICTTVLAVTIGIGMAYLIHSGDPSMAQLVDVAEDTNYSQNGVITSVKDIVLSVIPDSFTKPFADNTMIQILFLAVVVGIGVGKIGEYSKPLRDLFAALNELFMKLATYVTRFLPLFVFSSLASMTIKRNSSGAGSILKLYLPVLAGLGIIFLVYLAFLGLIARVNVITFLKKYIQTFVQVAFLGASSASIPLNLKVCEEKMGISSRIYSFTIPIGATVNMDGTCISLAAYGVSFSVIFGVDISGYKLLLLFITIVVLSIGAPGIPGIQLVCLSALLAQLQIPVAAIGLVAGLDTLIGSIRTSTNCMGDVMTTITVARSEKMMDMEKFNTP